MTSAIPILSKSFFQKHPPDEGFFSRWKEKAPWSDRCLPVYQWDDVLYVACLWAPEEFPQLNEKVVFVMCDHETLKTVWQEYQGTRSPIATSKKSALPPPPAVPNALSPDDLVGLLSPQKQYAPDELVLLDEEPSPENPELAEEPVDLLEISPPSPPVLTPESPLTASVTPPSPPAPANTAVATELLADEHTVDIPIAEVKKARPSEPVALHDLLINKNDPARTIKQELDPDIEVTKLSIKSLESKSPSALEAAMENIFSQMGYHFQKSMLLLKDSSNMKPYRWDQKFESSHSAQTADAIPLDNPSPWRIVMQTQKPFHGYVSSNDINDRFFDTWNSSQTPDHLTVVPVLVEDHVIGMLLGIGEKSADNKTSLLLAENLAKDLADQIRSRPDFFKAA